MRPLGRREDQPGIALTHRRVVELQNIYNLCYRVPELTRICRSAINVRVLCRSAYNAFFETGNDAAPRVSKQDPILGYLCAERICFVPLIG